MGLFGEVGEHVALVAGGYADQPSFLRGEEDLSCPEAAGHRAFHLPGHLVAFGVGDGTLGHGDGMGVGQTQAEAFRAFGQTAEVAASVEEVIDEFAAGGFLLPDGEVLGLVVSLGQCVDGLGHDGEGAVDRYGWARPGRTSGFEMVRDDLAQRRPVSRGLLAECAQGIEFAASETASGRGCRGQQVRVSMEAVSGCLGGAHRCSSCRGLSSG